MGGEQRAAPGAGLHDDRRVGEPADDPVAPRERAARRLDVGCQLRDDRPTARRDRLGEPPMRGREEPVVPAAEDADRHPVLRETGGVRGSVDTHSEPRHDGRSGASDRSGDARRHEAAGLRRPARPDDRDGSRHGERRTVAAHEQDVGRHLDLSEARRVVRVVERDDVDGRPLEAAKRLRGGAGGADHGREHRPGCGAVLVAGSLGERRHVAPRRQVQHRAGGARRRDHPAQRDRAEAVRGHEHGERLALRDAAAGPRRARGGPGRPHEAHGTQRPGPPDAKHQPASR
jgi:hypothetical protein